MRNGSGDEYSITFTGEGAFLRGFDLESPVSAFIQTPPALWPGILTGLPGELATVAQEPAFTLGGVPMVTVALWRLARGSSGVIGTSPTHGPGAPTTPAPSGQACWSREPTAPPE